MDQGEEAAFFELQKQVQVSKNDEQRVLFVAMQHARESRAETTSYKMSSSVSSNLAHNEETV
jgi:hypothetical protein